MNQLTASFFAPILPLARPLRQMLTARERNALCGQALPSDLGVVGCAILHRGGNRDSEKSIHIATVTQPEKLGAKP